MSPTEELRKEHEAVTLMLRILEKVCERLEAGQPVDLEHVARILEFLKVFVDTCHHGKEEEFLFPAMEAAGVAKEGGPIGVMLMEHTAGRAAIRGMTDAAAKLRENDHAAGAEFAKHARDYIGLLRAHIQKENNILFAMADRTLTQEKQQELSKHFDVIEQERIGPGKHEEFHDLLRHLKGVYLGP